MPRDGRCHEFVAEYCNPAAHPPTLTHGHTGGRTGGRADEQTGGRTDGRTGGRAGGRAGVQTGGQMDRLDGAAGGSGSTPLPFLPCPAYSYGPHEAGALPKWLPSGLVDRRGMISLISQSTAAASLDCVLAMLAEVCGKNCLKEHLHIIDANIDRSLVLPCLP